MKHWGVLACDESVVHALQDEWGIPRLLAVLLQTRGITKHEEIEELFRGDAVLSDPFALTDMDRAAQRIQEAVEGFQKIAVYGDYDADGVTATAMLYSYLESCGADVQYYIPEREGEGYGLNRNAIDVLRQRDVELIITVDNGISSIDEIAYGMELGMDVVVTDHHRPREVLPQCCAVVDPYREEDRGLPFRDFSGVGVAFKLIMALEGEDCDTQGLLDNYADLAAIGTIGDVVPLVSENRVLVKAGLRQINRTDRIGLRELLERAGVDGTVMTAGSVAFTLVPRINATGRIGSPDRAVHLLLSEYPEEAAEIAESICEDNNYRRQIEAELLEGALELLRREPRRLYDRILVVEGDGWHPGVIGIVASRLTTRFGKPCLVISYSGEEAKGSGRSVEGFSLFEAVRSCAPCLEKFGGHPMAAGFSLKTSSIEQFRRNINEYAASQSAMPFPAVTLDCKLSPRDLTVELPESLSCLEPFGTSNPAPLFGLFGFILTEITPVGGGKHLRLTFQKDGAVVRCMKFGIGLDDFSYSPGEVLDLAVSLESKPFNGKNSLTILIREMKPAQIQVDAALQGRTAYEKSMRREPLTHQELEELLPSREDFAAVYRQLRKSAGFRGREELLWVRLDAAMPLQKLLVALLVLKEHKLIQYENFGGVCDISVLPAQGKADLFDSRVLHALKSFVRGGD